MVIKSSFKDYYDFALSGISDVDRTITYARNLQIEKYDGPTLNSKSIYDMKDDTTDTINSLFFVCFNGEIYGGKQEVEIYREKWSSHKVLSEKYHYEDVSKYLTNNYFIDTIKKLKELGEQSPIVTLKYFSKVKETVPDLNIPWKKLDQEKKDRILKEQTKVVMLNESEKNPIFVLNDSLKNVGFNKIMDANQVYQSIESFIIRQNSLEKEVEFNDLEKRDQHGFDDYSFKMG